MFLKLSRISEVTIGNLLFLTISKFPILCLLHIPLYTTLIIVHFISLKIDLNVILAGI